eukprot:832097-Pyramimonas_sp.AAC.1
MFPKDPGTVPGRTRTATGHPPANSEKLKPLFHDRKKSRLRSIIIRYHGLTGLPGDTKMAQEHPRGAQRDSKPAPRTQ